MITPLYSLSDAICRNNESRLFPNQVVMYQLLITFMCGQFSSYSSKYNPLSIDELISDIRRYIEFMYENPGHITNSDQEKTFCLMHKFIYDNIAARESTIVVEPYACNDSVLSVTELGVTTTLAPNISKIIADDRGLPKKFEKILRDNSDNYSTLLYRFFWLLQYYFVYYEKDMCTISPSTIPNRTSSRFVEYFPLTDKKSASVYAALNKHCNSYTSYFSNKTNSLDLLSLSRIILDIIVEQIKLRKYIELDRVVDASHFTEKENFTITESEQFNIFQKYLGGFGSDSYDRYNMLLKFAPTNCYAAEELATMYYWGKSYWIRDNNYFELEQSYEKASEWYIKAIELSNPPLQSACWSLSYTLTNLHYDSEEDQKRAEKKAMEYLELAGEYPAAYNLIAWFLFRDTEKLFQEHKYDASTYEDILVKFLSAIRLANRASEMHWFYGSNQIALFLINHKDDKKLLEDLKNRLKLHISFDPESQLKNSVSYHNPWAIKHLALLYIEKGQKTEAKQLLKDAMETNYNAAYYEYAKLFKTGSKEWKKYMSEASRLSFPAATYELAACENDISEKNSLIALCRQQLLSEKHIDTELLNKAESLLSELENNTLIGKLAREYG